MLHKDAYRALHDTLCDIMDFRDPKTAPTFAGKVVVVGGDFRQTLPVVPNGGRGEAVNACLKASPLWDDFRELRLTGNQRVRRVEDPARRQQFADFVAWLQQLGDGDLPVCPEVGEDCIALQEHLISKTSTPEELMARVIGGGRPGGGINTATAEELTSSAVLTPLHSDVNALNAVAVQQFQARSGGPGAPAQDRTYLSVDVADRAEENTVFAPETLNSCDVPGLPPHALRLKTGMPVIVLRNLDVRRGPCNGTRAIVQRADRHCLTLLIMNGPLAGQTQFMPRITLLREPDQHLSIKMRRKQYPLKPAFALTINKAQGQTLRRVGVYLPNPVFSHGQLYVAASRVGDPDALEFLIPYGRRNDGRVYTRNVVYKEVLCR